MWKSLIQNHKNLVLPITFLVFILSWIWSASDYGLTWDEPLYYSAADSYLNWFNLILHSPIKGLESIDFYWCNNAQHPPLAKIVAGIFGSFGTYRLSGLFWIILLGIQVYRIVWDYSKSYLAAIVGALVTMSSPRVFSQSHFVELDLPLSVLWLATVFSFTKSIDSIKWQILTGVFLGLALLTKITAIFIWIPLVIYGVIYYRRAFLRPLIIVLTIGVIIFFVGWPWLWNSPIDRTFNYIRLFLTFKSPLKVMYLGTAYYSTPWHYPLFMLFVTIPLVVLILSFYGFFTGLRNKEPLCIISLINIMFVLALFSRPGTLVIDGIRYFLPVIGFVGIMAGIGISHLFQKLRYSTIWNIGICIILVMSLVISYMSVHPFGTSYYNSLIGGLKGARFFGMETTYWGEVMNKEVINYINKNYPENAKLKILPFYPANAPIEALSFFPDVIVYYQKKNILRKDLQFFSSPPYDGIVLISREGLYDSNCYYLRNKTIPKMKIVRDEVQLLGIY